MDDPAEDNFGGVKDAQSQGSFGTGSFTTGTFNARLAGSHGMQILKYIQSEDFGKYGESIKLIANIQVSHTLSFCTHHACSPRRNS